MYKKFGKDRSVDPLWFNVPIKYMSEIKGSDTESKSSHIETIEESYQKYVSWWNENPKWFEDETLPTLEEYKAMFDKGWLKLQTVYTTPKHDKDFVIIELSKKTALCAWRNGQTCKIGMPFRCKVEEKKDGTIGIIYKDKFYPINKSTAGWVW